MIICGLLCRELAKDFVVSGTASESLYGACESMYKPNMVCFDARCQPISLTSTFVLGPHLPCFIKFYFWMYITVVCSVSEMTSFCYFS